MHFSSDEPPRGQIVVDLDSLIRYILNHHLIHLHNEGHYSDEFALGCYQRDFEQESL